MMPSSDSTRTQSNPVPDLRLNAGAGASHPTRMLTCLNSRSFLFLTSIQDLSFSLNFTHSGLREDHEVYDIHSMVSCSTLYIFLFVPCIDR